VFPGLVLPVTSCCGLFVKGGSGSTSSHGAEVSGTTLISAEPMILPSIVAVTTTIPLSFGVTSKVAIPSLPVLFEALTPGPLTVTFAPSTGALVPISVTFAVIVEVLFG